MSRRGPLTSPVLPDLLRRDDGVACDLLVDVLGVGDEALGQDHVL